MRDPKTGELIKSRFESFTLDEISAVDRPAQPTALASIMKRAEEDPLETDKEDEDEERSSRYKGKTAPTEKGEAGVPDSAETSKSNSGESADSIGTVPNEVTMTEKNEKTVDETQAAVAKQLDELTKRAERAEKVAELNDAQMGIYKGLDQEGQESFLSMPVDQRDAEVAKAAEANAVVYVSKSNGQEFRKSDDPRLVQMAKQLDEEKDMREKKEKEAKKADLVRRAEELSHLPGDLDARVSMLKGIDSLPVAEQPVALEALKAADEAMSKAFERAGTASVPTQENPLDRIAKSIRESDPTLTPEAAMSKALDTPEGAAAYAKSLGL